MTLTYEELGRIQEAAFSRIRKLRETKGREYAHDADTLADFYEVAAEMGVTPLQCWGVYVKKHLRAIDTFVREGEVKSESIVGRVDDVLTYHVLLLGLLLDGDHVPSSAVLPVPTPPTPGGISSHTHDHPADEDCRPECPEWDPTHGDRRLASIPHGHQGHLCTVACSEFPGVPVR